MPGHWKKNDVDWLQHQQVAIIGFGSQGHAHALNLRDAGVPVLIGARPHGEGWQEALRQHFDVLPMQEAVARASWVSILLPDEVAVSCWHQELLPALRPGTVVAFAHGFNVHYGLIDIPSTSDVVLIAPKSPGTLVREMFLQGKGVPALIAVDQDASGLALPRAIEYAVALGCSRAGLLPTTFEEETETDLFGEQAVLCGGLQALVVAGFETLCQAGYQPELAYFECVHELKLIVDLLHEGGFEWLHTWISNNAEYGGLVAGESVIGPESRRAMEQLLKRIQSGEYAKDFILEQQAGMPRLHAARAHLRQHPIEQIGSQLRRSFEWQRPND